MDTDKNEEITRAIIGSAIEISRVLGAGFLEKVYERAMIQELALRGLGAKAQASYRICYKGHTSANILPILWWNRGSSWS